MFISMELRHSNPERRKSPFLTKSIRCLIVSTPLHPPPREQHLKILNDPKHLLLLISETTYVHVHPKGSHQIRIDLGELCHIDHDLT